jgi:sulfide:quinone oxidoreductase
VSGGGDRPIKVLILGAGFGGLELSTRLADDLGHRVEVTLIDKNDAFIFGFAKLDVMFGRRSLDDVKLSYRNVAKSRVAFCQETVMSIDPERKRVVTDRQTHEADILVVALGADLDVGATPGLIECGHEFYSPDGAARLSAILAEFEGGRVVIGVLGGFFKCPPAPYETAFMLHDQLTRRGVRGVSGITIVTPMPKPIPIADDVSAAILALCDERGIDYIHSSGVDRLEPRERVAVLRDGRHLPFDLFLGVPVHKAPQVVVDSGLTDDGWIAVDRATLATKFPDVYAVGDVTSAPVPRAGVIAEGEAATVAAVLVHRLTGGPVPAPFAGEVVCYMEMGDDHIGKVNVNFLSGPAPVARFTPPSLEGAEEKRQFAAIRRQRWFSGS